MPYPDPATYRRALGLSLAQAAKLSGYKPETVRKYERRVKVPLNAAEKLARIYGCSIWCFKPNGTIRTPGSSPAAVGANGRKIGNRRELQSPAKLRLVK